MAKPTYDATAKVAAEAKLPYGWHLSCAPGNGGFFVQPEGTRDRVGDFNPDPHACVEAFMASSEARTRVPDDAWQDLGGRLYLCETKLSGLIAGDKIGVCPHCEYDAKSEDDGDVIGITPPDPGADGYKSWTELRLCPGCAVHYVFYNST